MLEKKITSQLLENTLRATFKENHQNTINRWKIEDEYEMILGHKKLIKKRVEIVPTCLKVFYQEEVAFRGKIFIETEEVNDKIQKISKWLTDKTKKTGLIMFGMVGTGKTTFANAIRDTVNYLYGINSEIKATEVKCSTITKLARDGNFEEIEKIKKKPVLIIDDLGFESSSENVNHYGNKFNPIIDLMEYRYDKQLCTIITTNLDMEQIADLYGEKIADRLNEMMNKIDFQGGSFRK
jgi:DNA replication protein DnaC